ncbi:MAG: extracellular solute-binding protein [Acholeplasmatales bacterium]|jgi:spermidine/putrescine-binding protein|nr:extracellular solute-binding protein [Acholeplasmatales bacterium]
MKKLLGLLALGIIVIVFVFSGSGKGADLLILNWGDYLSSDVIHSFEEKYGVTVKEVNVESNEQMYQNILNQSAEYDLVVPSDYMIDQMKEDGLILELDYSLLENYEENIFVPELKMLMDSKDCENYRNYYIPYFWGSLGIMYSKRKAGVEEAVLTHGFKVFFEQNLLPLGSTVGMYNVSRDALAAAELYLGYSLNTKDKTKIDECLNLLKRTHFDYWGTDELKKNVSQGNLDVALVYSGDFFDAYYSDVEAEQYQNIENYSIYAPKEHNNVFFDGLAIPVTSTNPDLAYKMIDYLLEFDNSLENTSFVGYCPTLNSVFENVFSDEEWEDIVSIEAYNPSLIMNYPNSVAEVYCFLGNDIYAYIESLFITITS